jgi:tetratricopeptide (TPR) repeat protein
LRDLPRTAQDLFSKGEAAVKGGNYESATEIYTTILTNWKADAEACARASAGLGEAYIHLGNLRLAERYLQQAVGYRPLVPCYHYLLGFVYSVTRQWDRARVEFEFTVKHDPQNPEYLRGLGWVLCNSSRASKGRQYLHRALALAPDDVSILTNLALAYMDAREFGKALEYAQRAASIAPSNALVQLTLEVVAAVKHFTGNTHG